MRRGGVQGWVVGLCAALLLVALAAGAHASSGSQQAAPITLTLKTPTAAECKQQNQNAVVFGRACVIKVGLVAQEFWTVNPSSATWDTPTWLTTYAWTMPATIPAGGADMTMTLSAKEETGGANARICPAMGIRGGVELRVGGAAQPQPVTLGVCAQAGGSAPGNKKVKLVPSATQPPGSDVYIVVGLQDGPLYTYKYRAGVKSSSCRRPSALGASPRCRYRINFAVTQGGRRPKGLPGWVTDVVTAGTGTAVYSDSPGLVDDLVEKLQARVVRSMDVAKPDPDTGVRIDEVRLVFGPFKSRAGTVFAPQRAQVVLKLVASDDPLCPEEDDGEPRVAVLQLFDGRGKEPDKMRLEVDGCRHQTATFTGSIGPNSAVKVVISEKPA